MKLSVDAHACQGHARCSAVAPEVFHLNDDGFIDAEGDTEVPAEKLAAARRGVSACPERALLLTD